MTLFTLGAGSRLDDDRRGELETILLGSGGCVQWRTSTRANRTYALVDIPSERATAALREVTNRHRWAHPITVYEGTIIGLAVYPSAAQALPALGRALGGDGRPAGVLACAACRGGVVIEFDPRRTAAQLLRDLIEIELRRWGSGYETELLTPLPDEVWALVAAQGLPAPELHDDRTLEHLLGREASDAS